MLAGEKRAFDEFVSTSAPRLAAFAARRSGLNPAGLEDVVQSALIKAIRNLSGYRGEAALFTWLCEICRHELADVQRKEARQPVHVSLHDRSGSQTVVAQLQIPVRMEPPAELVSDQRRTAVLQVLESLPRHYAVALEAKYGDNLGVDGIADLLGLSFSATQSLLARARQAFRDQWRRMGLDVVEDGSTS